MNGYECISESINIFESRLVEALAGKANHESLLSANSLAEISGYSLWHFTRMFSYVTGFTPKNYITSRIFTECSRYLIQNRNDSSFKPISFIANAAGFSDAATFSRAFRNWAGITPSELRKAGSCSKLSEIMQKPIDLQKNILSGKLDAKIEECDAIHITGISFFITKRITSFDYLWKEFTNKSKEIKTITKEKKYCQYTAWTPSTNGCNDNGQMLVVCAVVTDEKTVQDPIFFERTIPGGKYLHVVHTGSMSEIGETYRKIYCDYFANLEIKLISGWEYQVYREDGITDIFIPIF